MFASRNTQRPRYLVICFIEILFADPGSFSPTYCRADNREGFNLPGCRYRIWKKRTFSSVFGSTDDQLCGQDELDDILAVEKEREAGLPEMAGNALTYPGGLKAYLSRVGDRKQDFFINEDLLLRSLMDNISG